MSAAEWWLKLVLRINGVLAVMAVVAVLAPHAWLVWCVEKVDPDLPVRALVSYLARMLSALYVLLGVMLLVFATDVRCHARAIRLLMFWCYFVVAAMLAQAVPYFSLLLRQRFFWLIAADGLYGVAMATAVLLLQRRIAREDAT